MTRAELNQLKKINSIALNNCPKESRISIKAIGFITTIGMTAVGLATIIFTCLPN